MSRGLVNTEAAAAGPGLVGRRLAEPAEGLGRDIACLAAVIRLAEVDHGPVLTPSLGAFPYGTLVAKPWSSS